MIHFGPALAARSSDMSEHLFLMPVATQFQLALDKPFRSAHLPAMDMHIMRRTISDRGPK